MSLPSPFKIVFLQDDFPPESGGGAATVAASLARQFHARGFDVAVIASTQKKELEGKSEWEGIPVYRIYSSYHERWRAWRSLYNSSVMPKVEALLQELKPQVVHAHNVHYHLSYASLFAAKATGAKVILTAHDAMTISYGKLPPDGKVSVWRDLVRNKLRFNPLRNMQIKHCLESVDVIVAVSNALAETLTKAGVPVAAVVYNGIDEKEWEVSQASVDTFIKTHALQDKKVILFGGRISPQKGGDALLSALPTIVEKDPRAVLAIAGKENDYVRSLKERAEKLNVAKHVLTPGWLSGDALKALYKAAEVVVVPSLYLDPLPTVVLEAMICKKPVVASPFGGLPEMVLNGKTGSIVDPKDTHALAQAISSLLTNEEQARRMGEEGYARAVQEFSFEKQIAALLSIYEK